MSPVTAGTVVEHFHGGFGSSRSAVSGDRAWNESGFGPCNEPHGRFLAQAKQETENGWTYTQRAAIKWLSKCLSAHKAHICRGWDSNPHGGSLL
ncbi:MAG: hypothetical protein V3U26_04075, partial [Dehalococcoidia bacterium]